MEELVLLSLAVWQTVEVWRHSKLTAVPRAVVQTWTGWARDLLLCPWCLSVWVGLFWAALWLIVEQTPFAADDWLVRILLTGLACSRAANAANDLTHPFCRTPRMVLEPPHGQDPASADDRTHR